MSGKYIDSYELQSSSLDLVIYLVSTDFYVCFKQNMRLQLCIKPYNCTDNLSMKRYSNKSQIGEF